MKHIFSRVILTMLSVAVIIFISGCESDDQTQPPAATPQPTPVVTPTPAPTPTPTPGMVRVTVNGVVVQFTQPIVSVDGHTLAEINPIADLIGMEVRWNPETLTVTLLQEDFGVALQAENYIMTMRDLDIGIEDIASLDLAPIMINNVIHIPIEVVAQAFGAEVVWDATNRVVAITMSDFAGIPESPISMPQPIVFSDTFLDTTRLDSAWTRTNGDQWRFDGANGYHLMASYGWLVLASNHLPGSLQDSFTISFEAMGGVLGRFWLGRDADGNVSDGFGLTRGGNISYWGTHNSNAVTIGGLPSHPADQFATIRIEVWEGQADIFFNDVYIQSRELVGARPGFAFQRRDTNYHIRNFSITVN